MLRTLPFMTAPVAYLPLLAAAAPVFAAAALGYVARRVRWLNADADQSLLRLTVNLLTPCLVLDSVLGNASLRAGGTAAGAAALGFLAVCSCFVLAFAAARLARVPAGPSRATFILSTGMFNYGYLALPLTLALFGRETAGVLFVFNVGVEFALWTVGVALLHGDLRRGWRAALSPPAIAVLAALALNFLGARDWLPGPVLATAHFVGAAAIPLGLLLSGATIADVLEGGGFQPRARVSLPALLVRLAAAPLLFISVALLLPRQPELQRVLVTQAAMPAAMLPIVLSRLYHGDPAIALEVVLVTTLAAVVTLPFWLQVGLSLVGSAG